MSTLTAQVIHAATENNDSVASEVWFQSYSGRGMGGRLCPAVGLGKLSDLVPLGAAIAYELAATCNPYEVDAEAIPDAVAEGLAPEIDQLGCGYIAYWPAVSWNGDAEASV